MALTKVPPKSLPWLLVIFGILGAFGLVGLLTQNHIWPFNQTGAPPARAPATTPPP
jgi:hypothetical protein